MPFNSLPRILYVDGDQDTRDMLGMLLRHSLIETKGVATADQAFALIQAEHFDVYLLEAWLPDVDGFELCRRLRACDQHTPIVFFSGAAYPADRVKGLEAGANAYVTKPDIEGLVSNLMKYAFQHELVAA